MTWNGKVCLVTGAASGIGRSTLLQLAERGAAVYGCDIDHDAINSMNEEIARRGFTSCSITACDVGNQTQLCEWIDKVARCEGRIDVLVTCAAFVRWDRVENLTPEELQSVLCVGLNGTILAVRCVLPTMQDQGYGRIVALSSVTARLHLFEGYAAYAASKAGIEAFMNILQIELRQTDIRAMVMRPGLVWGTGFFEKQVKPDVLPRVTDFLPSTAPERLSRVIVRMLERPRNSCTYPRMYRMLEFIYYCLPGLSRWISRIGGSSRRTSARDSESIEVK